MTTRTNYVLVDFENVQLQPDSLKLLAREHFRLLIFVGANQGKISTDMVVLVQTLGSNAEYIKMSGNGPNALDFHIAYYLGRLAEKEPTAFFHILSKDTGFDPLIRHLREKGIYSDRVESIADIPLIKASIAKTPAERSQLILAGLRRPKATRPGTEEKLRNHINAQFQKKLSKEEVDAIIQTLVKQKCLSINEGKVQYAGLSQGADS